MVTINIKKKDLYLITAIFVFLVGAGFVIAYGGTSPSVMGHSYNEIQRCGEGQILKIVGGVWACVNSPSCRMCTNACGGKYPAVMGAFVSLSVSAVDIYPSGCSGTYSYVGPPATIFLCCAT